MDFPCLSQLVLVKKQLTKEDVVTTVSGQAETRDVAAVFFKPDA